MRRLLRSSNIFAIFVFALWATLLWVGSDLIQAVTGRVGSSDLEQQVFYIGIPALIVPVFTASFVVFNFIRNLPMALASVSAIALLLLLPFLFFTAAAYKRLPKPS